MFKTALLSRQLPLISRPFSVSSVRSGLPNELLKSLGSLHQLLMSKDSTTKEVQKVVTKKLNKLNAYESSEERTKIYQSLVSILAYHRRKEAYWVAEVMEQEGMEISELARATLLIIKLLNKSTEASRDPRDSQMALADIFRSESFSEKYLLTLLKSFRWDVDTARGSRNNRNHRFRLYLIRTFIEAKPAGYKPSTKLTNLLVKYQISSGDIDGAYEALRDFSTELAEGNISQPYLTAIIESDPSEEDFFGKVMELMQEKEVGGDVDTFNALIQRERARGSHARIVGFYKVLRDLFSTGSSIGPDGTTFLLLFSSMATTYDKKDKTLTPRNVFRDMYFMHLHSPSHAPPTNRDYMFQDTDLLNRALLAFLSNIDYPAAIVTLHAFFRIGIPVDVTTFKHVITHLGAKIHATVKMNISGWWERFIHEPYALGKGMVCVRPKMHDKLLELLLRSLKSSGRRIGRRYVLPTLKMIQGEHPVPWSARLDVVPLEDFLILALKEQLKVLAGTEQDLEALVAKQISEAHESMMPKHIAARNWGCPPRPRAHFDYHDIRPHST